MILSGSKTVNTIFLNIILSLFLWYGMLNYLLIHQLKGIQKHLIMNTFAVIETGQNFSLSWGGIKCWKCCVGQALFGRSRYGRANKISVFWIWRLVFSFFLNRFSQKRLNLPRFWSLNVNSGCKIFIANCPSQPWKSAEIWLNEFRLQIVAILLRVQGGNGVSASEPAEVVFSVSKGVGFGFRFRKKKIHWERWRIVT